MPISLEQRGKMIRSLATYIWCAKIQGIPRESCSAEIDYHEFLRPYISDNTLQMLFNIFGGNRQELEDLESITIAPSDYYSLVEQVYIQQRAVNMVSLPYSAPLPVPVTADSSFFQKYISNAINGDKKTEIAVNETISRMNLILSERSSYEQRISGLVVGRVQSGKTRNYIGLMLKAFDEGWNVIIVLTSDNVALAHQTRKRICSDFAKSDVTNADNTELQFLNNQDIQIIPNVLNRDNAHHLFWGVAMKEKSNLRRLNNWFSSNQAYVERMRVLVIDDEADNATPDSRANRQNQLTEEDLENLIETLGDEDEERFQNIAYWMISLQDKEFPELPEDEEDDTPEQHDYRELRNFLSLQTGYRNAVEQIFNRASFRELLNVELRDAAGQHLFDLQAILDYFHNTHGERSAKMLICAINTILEISSSRSTINRYICTFVDKAQDEAEYAYKFQKCAYIGYTATPYACVLNENPDQTALYPDFIRSLEKSPKYFGLEEIFGEEIKMPGTNIPNTIPRMGIVRPIIEEESHYILHPLQNIKEITGVRGANQRVQLKVEIDQNLNYKCSNNRTGVWSSLKDAIAWAFCTAAARSFYRIEVLRKKLDNDDSLTENERREKMNDIERRWTTMLVNITHKKETHQKLCDVINAYLQTKCSTENAAKVFLEECHRLWDVETTKFTKADFDNLFNSHDATEDSRYGEIEDYPAWNCIEEYLQRFIVGWNNDKVHTIVINSQDRKQQEYYTQDPDKVGRDVSEVTGDNLWIICGGNTISRGLTLAGLTVSYFDRVRKTIAVDTMTQMGRWFGYRGDYELLPRLWLVGETVVEMKKTAVVEDRMHSSMVYNFSEGFSPSDASHYQIIYSFGRKLSGRAKAQKTLTEGIGTFGSTSYFTKETLNARQIYDHTCAFLNSLGGKFIRSKDEYYYYYVPCWNNISQNEIQNYLEQIKAFYPSNSKIMIESLLKEIQQCENTDNWDVVIGTPRGVTGDESDREGKSYQLGQERYLSGSPDVMPRVDENTVRFSGSARLYTAYYAMIPTLDLNKVDVVNLERNLREIEEIISEKVKENRDADGNENLPANIDLALPLRGQEPDWRVRLRALMQNLKNDSSLIIPRAIHGLFRQLGSCPNDRSTGEYMEKVHKQAGHTNPILQFYLITPPEHDLEDLPLIAISFFWPGHQSDTFYANCVGIEVERRNPTERKFYATVEDVLRKCNFPMQTRTLRGTVMNRLPGCTEAFFSSMIRRGIERRPYAVFTGRDAYYMKDWAPNPEERLQRELIACTIDYLKNNSQPVRRDQLLYKVLSLNPKFKGFFSSRENSPDHALLSRLLTDEILKENDIVIRSQRPITYQYAPLD